MFISLSFNYNTRHFLKALCLITYRHSHRSLKINIFTRIVFNNGMDLLCIIFDICIKLMPFRKYLNFSIFLQVLFNGKSFFHTNLIFSLQVMKIKNN